MKNLAKERARDYARQIVLPNQTLPDKAFSVEWDLFLFCDADWFRDRSFIESAKQIIALQRDEYICAVNLDYEQSHIDPPDFSVVAHVEPDTESFLRPLNWTTYMVRTAISSDTGNWAIFCDPMAEIAVMAFRSEEIIRHMQPIISRVHARTLRESIAAPQIIAFEKGVPSFIAALLKNYTRA